MSGFLQFSPSNSIQGVRDAQNHSEMIAAGGCVSILLWPFWALWQLVAGLLRLTGRIVCAILGFTFMIVGVVLTVTIVGAVVGIPLILFGLLLVVRSLF